MLRIVTSVSFLALLIPAAYAQQPGDVRTLRGDEGQYIVFFDIDSANLDARARDVVAAAADDFRRTGAARLEVRGHTDTSGSAEHNQVLSERRAELVADALVGVGVPRAAIISTGAGEMELLIPTADGVTEPRNRRAEIFIERPAPPPVTPTPPPAVIEPEPVPPPVAAAPVEQPREPARGVFSVGALYGFNLLDEGDDEGTDDKTSHLAGVNLGFDYAFTDFTALSLEQAGFYNFGTDDDGFGGRTAAGLNFFPAFLDIIPYVGGNIGYLYGSGLDDEFFAGPEIGINLGFLDAKVAYDMPFGRGIDEGIIFTTIGLGLRF